MFNHDAFDACILPYWEKKFCYYCRAHIRSILRANLLRINVVKVEEQFICR